MGGRAKAQNIATQGTTACAHGNGSNTQAAARGGNTNSRRGWPAWNGDVRMVRNEGRIEMVNCALVDLPAGQYGTQTPVTAEYLDAVCPGLAS